VNHVSESGRSMSVERDRVNGRGPSDGDDCRVGGRASESGDDRCDRDRRDSVSGLDRSVLSRNESVSGRCGSACHVSGDCCWIDGWCDGCDLANGRVVGVESLSGLRERTSSMRC
jgi:hypothetical protein